MVRRPAGLVVRLPLVKRAIRRQRLVSGTPARGPGPEAMVAAANVAAYDTFALLQRYGRDVAGAVVVSDEDPAGRPGSVDYYTQEGLDADVGGLESRPLALYDDSELSLAGPGVLRHRVCRRVPL